MSAFAHPAFLAGASFLLALAIHPGVRTASGLAVAPVVVAILALFVLLSLAAVARRGPGEALLAAGALVLVGALAWDGARGQRGELLLRVGEGKNNFTEEGLGGRPLGLRPLGTSLLLESLRPDGSARLRLPAGPVDLAPDRAASLAGFRVGPVRAGPSGDARSLVVAVTIGTETRETEVRPDLPGRVAGLTIVLERYFPDFALDAKQQPYSRSNEPRNPGALLEVERAGKRHRVFVLQSMPGLHRVEEIEGSFTLVSVEPDVRADIGVHREPAAGLALAGALLLGAGACTLAARGRRP